MAITYIYMDISEIKKHYKGREKKKKKSTMYSMKIEVI